VNGILEWHKTHIKASKATGSKATGSKSFDAPVWRLLRHLSECDSLKSSGGFLQNGLRCILRNERVNVKKLVDALQDAARLCLTARNANTGVGAGGAAAARNLGVSIRVPVWLLLVEVAARAASNDMIDAVVEASDAPPGDFAVGCWARLLEHIKEEEGAAGAAGWAVNHSASMTAPPTGEHAAPKSGDLHELATHVLRVVTLSADTIPTDQATETAGNMLALLQVRGGAGGLRWKQSRTRKRR
jgi:hypothetical protein